MIAELNTLLFLLVTVGSRHPQTGQDLRFLPPDSWIGILVRIPRYFNALECSTALDAVSRD